MGVVCMSRQRVLDFFLAQACRYEFVYRHRWRRNDLVIWDNRCSLHYAVPDYDATDDRIMIRCSVGGEESGRLYDDELP